MVRIDRLRWTPGNIAHIERHGVRPMEVEDVCHGEFIVRKGYEGRMVVIGATQSGRMLAVGRELLTAVHTIR